MPSLKFPFGLQVSGILRQLEHDIETVINVLQPGPLGIIEHKFSTKEVNEAKEIVKRSIENWRRHAALERSGGIGHHSRNKAS